MRSWWSPSPEEQIAGGTAAGADEMARRFVEASRRAEIVTLVNQARTLASLGEQVTAELAEAFEAEVAFVLAEHAPGAPLELVAATGLVGDQSGLLLRAKVCIEALHDGAGVQHAGADLLDLGIRRLALEPISASSGGRILVGVGRLYEQPYDPAEIALLAAIARSTGHAIERFWLADEGVRRSAQQAALARAAKSVNASLDRDRVLEALCREVAGALGADVVNVYFGGEGEGLVAVASYGIGTDFVGFRRAEGEGLCGRAVRTGRAQLSNAYQSEELAPRSTAALNAVRTAVAVPLQRYDGIDGAISAGFVSDRWADERDAELLSAFAELAAVACRNADEHADAQRAAMVDPLTGCLNHGAFQMLLRDEISRCERGTNEGSGLVLALVDLHDFKSINERFGHPAGDGVLRSVGQLLRGAVRAYDQVARYGGDEFALLLPNAAAEDAQAAVARAREALLQARAPDGRPVECAVGLATWRPGDQALDIIERADQALLAGKRDEEPPPDTADGGRAAAPVVGPAAEARRIADRRARRLAAAGRIGGRLARLLDASAIADAAVTELQAALGAEWCRLVRLHEEGYVSAVAQSGGRPSIIASWSQPQDEGTIGRALRERRPVLRSSGTESWPAVEMAVPVVSGGQLWGCFDVLAYGEGALNADDADFAEVVADHLGAALHTADLYRRLDQAYLGTAEALAAALEAKDDYTADHARSIADLAVAVGRELDLDEEALRDLRYGAVFHDIGKIAIPDAILNKAGPLTPDEFEVIKTHPIVGEQILAPVPFLSKVRRIVRHDHERWDGAGYPDALRGPQIPIGARIVFVVDSWHAMTSDRPYRARMSDSDAIAELRKHAGSQFDPTVVEAFLRVQRREAAVH
jgi:diguanylate cyclase (GGDEF)-like protein